MSRIWTLTPNPALDTTYRIPQLTIGIPHRINDVTVRPGGKGLNVSRVLGQLGVETHATGFVGGANGRRLLELLADLPVSDKVRACFIETSAQTRLSIAVVDGDSEATVLNEAGETPTDSEWEALLTFLGTSLQPGDLLASCGSFPGVSSPEWMTRLVETVHGVGARILVDASGAVLHAACAAGADFVKPNDLELQETTGCDSVPEGAAQLLSAGVKAVITSEGAKGMSVHTRDGAFRAKPAQLVSGNPTGAGDASVAAWCHHLVGLFAGKPAEWMPSAQDLAEGLPLAVALSGAAVACPVAGEVNLDLFATMQPNVKVEEY
ncbi:hexose kinase, 1-phosphofructokinase family [Gleimia coleocanis DSM 15436]|uniref:Hexose kinase, 1-phosphofructokinase family n=1 Tax=Gleimia coleocanis DSM 15436 TaxID=525245 RepID=C0VYG5_9ACTO|nr:hexose kinase [Gleimia coleocanis]EEH64468.1 hexose kinase, 1-phosphofructokinase family [Gleimia coleocanis DSM 15436]